MNLSYSLVDHYEACQFRTKLFDFERVARSEGAGDVLRSLIGEFAHEGQRALILGEDPRTAIRRKLWRCDQLPPGFSEEWPAERLLDRACGMVARWSRSVPSFDYKDLRPYVYHEPARSHDAGSVEVPRGCEVYDGGHIETPLVDQKLWVPLDPAIGIFKALVFKPDFVGFDAHDHLWVYDWKWVSTLDEPDAFRYDLQSAMYQWGLARLGIKVVGHAIVQGLIEEPTPFRTRKDGRVSTRVIRNSYEEYVAACQRAGHEPDPTMAERLAPTFRHHVNFRSLREVEAIWRETVVPKALAISRSAEGAGFYRRWAKHICGRCTVRDDCQLGQLGHHEDVRFNTTQWTQLRGTVEAK